MRLPAKTEAKKRAYQHNRCFYCGNTLMLGYTEVDHIIPFSSSRDGSTANLCLSCKHCNRIKATLDMSQFLAKVAVYYPDKLIRGMFYFQFLNLTNV